MSQDSSSNSAPTQRGDFQSLVEWFRDKGGSVDPRLTSASVNGVRGIFATGDIEPGTVLLDCPWELVIRAKDPDLTDSACGMVTMIEREIAKGPDSFWYPYFQFLEPIEIRLPTLWDLHSLGELQGLPPHDCMRHLHWYAESCLDGVPFTEINSSQRKALLIYTTRVAESGLIPLFDCLNHHLGELNTWFLKSETGVQIKAARLISARQQIFTAYRSAAETVELFRDYGFIEHWPQIWRWEDNSGTPHSFMRFPIARVAIEPSTEFIALFGQVGLVLEECRSQASRYTLEMSTETLRKFLHSARELEEKLPTTALEDEQILDQLQSTHLTSEIARNKQSDLISCVRYRMEFKNALREAIVAAEEAAETK